MRKLATDVTEFHQPWGKAYLSPVMDLHNNEIVAWSVSRHPNKALIDEMLDMLEPRLDGPALLHSDQGWQYQQRTYQDRIESLGLEQSMSRKATCLDNACIEGFFGHMKDEFPRQRLHRGVLRAYEGRVLQGRGVRVVRRPQAGA